MFCDGITVYSRILDNASETGTAIYTNGYKWPFFANTEIKLMRAFGIEKPTIVVETTDNKIYVQGRNYYGSLGVGHENVVDIFTLIDIPTTSTIIDIVINPHAMVILCSDHTIYICGKINMFDDQKYNKIPTKIESSIDIVQIALSDNCLIASSADGKIYKCSKNLNWNLVQPLLFNNDKIKSITNSCTIQTTLTVTGDVYTWGTNWYGQLGLNGITVDGSSIVLNPTKIQFDCKLCVRLLAVGTGFSFVLTECGKVYSWGCNSNGQLGLGHTRNQPTPRLVKTIADLNIDVNDIQCGIDYTIIITSELSVYLCGKGPIGLTCSTINDALIPTIVPFFESHTLVLDDAKRFWKTKSANN